MHVLHNLMEDSVLQVINDLISDDYMCTCEQCQLDIAAIALSNLPPRYVVTSKGASYAKADLLEMQKYVDIIGAVTKAIKLVREHPRHAKSVISE